MLDSFYIILCLLLIYHFLFITLSAEVYIDDGGYCIMALLTHFCW